MIRVLDSAGSTLVEWGRQQHKHTFKGVILSLPQRPFDMVARKVPNKGQCLVQEGKQYHNTKPRLSLVDTAAQVAYHKLALSVISVPAVNMDYMKIPFSDICLQRVFSKLLKKGYKKHHREVPVVEQTSIKQAPQKTM